MNRKHFIFIVILFICSFVLLHSLWYENQGDVDLYQYHVDQTLQGDLPYRDHVLEYPPYSLLVFALPSIAVKLFGDLDYLKYFLLLALCADLIIKILLYLNSRRKAESDQKSLMPLIYYSIAVSFISYFYLQRFDVWPSLLSLYAIILFSKKRFSFSGIVLAIAIGVKLYPIIFTPALFVLAWREGKAKKFTRGLLLGLLPIVLLSFYLPWWRFATFHTARGLQVESLYASILWLGHHLGLVQVQWEYTKGWFEVTGPISAALLIWAKSIFIMIVGISTLISIKRALRSPHVDITYLSRLLLIPLLGFVAFNLVLSPQYVIWILPLAALSIADKAKAVAIVILIATILTPFFYPTSEYFSPTGLNLFETILLVGRNLLLVSAWVMLVREQRVDFS